MRRLATLLLPFMLLSCTQSELKQIFPPNQGGTDTTAEEITVTAAGRITVTAENPGAGATACDVLNVTVRTDNTQIAQSHDLVSGGQWSRVLSATDLANTSAVQLRAVCSVSATDASGSTVMVAGYSVSSHPVTSAAQSITVTGPRAKQNLAARVEWSTPVPGVLPLDQ